MSMDNVQLKIQERLRAAFSEVMQKGGVLIDEALDEHFVDMKDIFLRDRALAVSLALAVDMNEAGQIEVAITCGYVKEKVKQKTTARVTPGQTEIPVEAYRTVPADQEQQERGPICDESRMLGAGAPQLAAGEPLHMGAGEGGDEGAQEQRDADRMSGRGPCNVGSRQCSDSPFCCGDGMEYVDVENRLMRVKEMDAEQLRQVIALPGCQKSVVKAAAARLKKLVAAEFEELREEKAQAGRTCKTCHNNLPGGCDLEGECDNTNSRWQPVAGAA